MVNRTATVRASADKDRLIGLISLDRLSNFDTILHIPLCVISLTTWELGAEKYGATRASITTLNSRPTIHLRRLSQSVEDPIALFGVSSDSVALDWLTPPRSNRIYAGNQQLQQLQRADR